MKNAIQLLTESYDYIARSLISLIDGDTEDKEALAKANREIIELEAKIKESTEKSKELEIALNSITKSFSDLAVKALAATVDETKVVTQEANEPEGMEIDEDDLKTSIEENI